MTSKNALLKILFGFVIFLFSLAFAYFVASYLENGKIFDYWLALSIAAIVYVIIGVFVSSFFSISLGFLFAADVLVLHVLFEKYDQILSIWKTGLVGVVLLTLYGFAWYKLVEKSTSQVFVSSPPPPSSTPTA